MYNATAMGLLVRTDPAKAKQELERVIARVHGDRIRAAAQYGVTPRTWHRWIVGVGLDEHAAKVRKEVAEKARKNAARRAASGNTVSER